MPAPQKQEILGEAIQNSRKKLDTLREAQEDIEKQFKSGDIGAEQYRAFKREVEKAEAELKNIRTNQNAAQTGGKNKILIPSSKDMTTTTTNGGNENATEQPQQ